MEPNLRIVRPRYPANIILPVCALLLGIGGAALAHRFIIRIAAPPPMACVGWTIYLNDLVGLEPTVPEFEAKELGVLDDPKCQQFLLAIANGIQRSGTIARAQIADVYLVPFQAEGLTRRGWPFASEGPYSIVFLVPRGPAPIIEIQADESGNAPFRSLGFLANVIVYFVVFSTTGFLMIRVVHAMTARRLRRRAGFPVLRVEGPTLTERDFGH